MSKSRKTVAIADVVAKVNRMIEVSPDDHKQGRYALATLLESVLLDTDNYAGYNYLTSEFKKDGEAGIWDNLPNPPSSQLRVGYDDSRRVYFHRS